MAQFQDAFISYGRIDSKSFAIALYQKLTNLGYNVWLDQTDIPFAVNYQTHIDRSIETAHNLIFILSPHSVNSPHCGIELEQALRYNKRVIPIMHVEEISYETWRQRYPLGTTEDWHTYRAKGLHSAMANLPPTIEKINWINFRPGIDDSKQALQQLLNTFADRQAYVHQHTQYLALALEWEHSQRQPRYLLSGDQREAAEAWLKQAFEEKPPFAQPTDLHCEFITESTKYADSQLTQVFLCYSTQEPSELKARALAAAQTNVGLGTEPTVSTAPLSTSLSLKRLLRRAGFTIWDRQQDISTGSRIQTAITQGIEGADNFIFLLSPQSLTSERCLEELTYAEQLHKRIIPVQIAPVAPDQIPPFIRDVYRINLQGVNSPTLPQSGIRALITTLRQDATYFQTHKRLLVEAIKWQRQRYNPSVLLRGAELRHYQSWLQTARQRQHCQPTNLQIKFVNEGLAQPSTLPLDVFLIADPADLDFARRLNNTLQLQSKSTWFDQASRLTSVETDEFLNNSQNCLVVLSPEALKNPRCLAYLEQAHTLHKRLIGVQWQEIDPTDLPESLTTSPIVNFQDWEQDFASNFGELYRILESDADHVAQHTRLLVRALEWEAAGRDDGFLLRSKELKRASQWLEAAQGKVPGPGPQHQDYIAASCQLPFRRVTWRTVGLSGMVTTLALFGLRLVGALQPLELGAYDLLLRHRPSETQDTHSVVVTVEETSGSWLRERMESGVYRPGIGTVPDAALADALTILQEADPAVIGLDFFRDFSATPELAQMFRSIDNLIGLCKATYQGQGVSAPADMPAARVGFNDLVNDGRDFMRRSLLKQGADPPDCDTEDAFSLKLAQVYLQHHGITYTDPWANPNQIQDMRVGNRRVPQLWSAGILTSQTAGYGPLNHSNFEGYQTLINYRAHGGDANQYAPQISLEDVLTRRFDPALVQDRIVVIGYKDFADRNADFYNTSYGELPGIILQGQMASQLVAAAIDQRPLIWWWPVWAETLWIALWAGVGGLVLRQCIGPVLVTLGSLVGFGSLIGLCYGALTLTGLWLPVVPPLLAGVGTAGLVTYFNLRVRNP